MLKQPWGFGQASFPSGWRYGLLLPRRTVASRAYLPGPKERMALGRTRIPFWWVMDFTLEPQASGDGTITPIYNFTLLSMMATSEQEAGFRTQNFQLSDNCGSGAAFSRVGIDFPNAAGTAQRPLFIKKPYPMPNMLSLLNRTANLDATVDTTNDVQLAFYGVRDMDHMGVPGQP